MFILDNDSWIHGDFGMCSMSLSLYHLFLLDLKIYICFLFLYINMTLRNAFIKNPSNKKNLVLKSTKNAALKCTMKSVLKCTMNSALKCTMKSALKCTMNSALKCTMK